MSLSEKAIKEFQEIYKKEYGKEIPYDEAAEAARNLVGLFEVLYDSHIREMKLKEKLKDSPKGFSIMDGSTYNCGICHDQIKDEKLWYDKWGKKCLACQDAVDKKKIHGSICYHDEKWYAIWEFDMYFKMRAPTVKKLIRQGILKARIVPKSGFEVMLLKENSDVLPPKKLVEHVSIPDKDNPRRITITPWYEIYDPDKLLKGYKILPYLIALKEEVKKNRLDKNKFKYKMPPNITIRQEALNDYQETETVAREAFWDVYKPGCHEHLVLHKLRKTLAFVKELDLVACDGNKIVGMVVCPKSKIVNEEGQEFEALSMMVGVSPSHQKKGIGEMLIKQAIKTARNLGYKGIVIFGDPKYYSRFGFKNAKEYGIQTSDGQNFDPFMALEVSEGDLKGIKSRFFEAPSFQPLNDESELEEFDKQFPHKEKHIIGTQLKP